MILKYSPLLYFYIKFGCLSTGFGPDGPYANRAGFDVIAAAMGGLLHITGPEV